MTDAAAAGSGAPGPSAAVRPRDDPVYLLRSESPQVYLSWGSQLPRALDRLKLRKVVNVWPIQFTLKADYETRSREFTYGASCKDTLLKGRFSLNMPHQRVEYRKKLSLGNGVALALAGSFSYANMAERRWDPCFGFQLEFGEWGVGGSRSGSHAVWAGSSFDVRQKFRVQKGLRMEVCGSVKLPTPAARYRLDSSTLSIGDGAFHLHVAEVNAIVKF